MRIIVTGLIAQHPLGGVTWDYLQYVLGLQRLGHDVYYVEDSGAWPYALDGGSSGEAFAVADCGANVAYLARVMSRFELSQRWAYRCPIDGRWSGLTDAARQDVIASAELLLNVSSTVLRPAEYRRIPRLAFVDSDPVFTQIKLARGHTFAAKTLEGEWVFDMFWVYRLYSNFSVKTGLFGFIDRAKATLSELAGDLILVI